MTALASSERRLVVGIADAAASADPTNTIITHALGSCLGVVMFDPVAHVAGMLHAMLPERSAAGPQACDNNAMFIDTGVPLLLERCLALGATSRRLWVKVAGGARMGTSSTDYFKVGERNMTALRLALWKSGLLLRGQDVGGNLSRTMSVRASDGVVTVVGEGGMRRL